MFHKIEFSGLFCVFDCTYWWRQFHFYYIFISFASLYRESKNRYLKYYNWNKEMQLYLMIFVIILFFKQKYINTKRKTYLWNSTLQQLRWIYNQNRCSPNRHKKSSSFRPLYRPDVAHTPSIQHSACIGWGRLQNLCEGWKTGCSFT